jgi:hypothetical protein
VKGKGMMKTYFVLGKNVSQLNSPVLMPAGIPQTNTSPSLQRQTSQHSSLAAVVLRMQATKRVPNVNSREYMF